MTAGTGTHMATHTLEYLRVERRWSAARQLVLTAGVADNDADDWSLRLAADGVVLRVLALGEVPPALEPGSHGVLVLGDAVSGSDATALVAVSGKLPIVRLLRDFSVNAVLEAHGYADLVLPAPVSTEDMVRALKQLLEKRDATATFIRNHRLSPREAALLMRALQGLNNDECAAALGCSRTTVATYWNRIFRKTGVSGQRDVMLQILRIAERTLR